VPNKFTTELKEAMLQAAQDVGEVEEATSSKLLPTSSLAIGLKFLEYKKPDPVQ
jgi:hypothetical protein